MELLDANIILSLPLVGTSIQAYVDDQALTASNTHAWQNSLMISRMYTNALNISRTHGFKFAPKKSKAIHFSRKRSKELTPVYLDGQECKIYDDVTYLGVKLDRRLLFEKHLTHIKEKLHLKMGPFACHGSSTRGTDLHSRRRRIFEAVIVPAILFGCAHPPNITGLKG
jgi:hypothetical protein